MLLLHSIGIGNTFCGDRFQTWSQPSSQPEDVEEKGGREEEKGNFWGRSKPSYRTGSTLPGNSWSVRVTHQLHFLLVLSFLYSMPICSAFVYIFSCYVTRIPRVRSNMNPLNKHALLTVQCTVSIKSGCQGHNCGRGGRQLLPNDQLKDQGLSRRQKKLEKFYDLDLDV